MRGLQRLSMILGCVILAAITIASYSTEARFSLLVSEENVVAEPIELKPRNAGLSGTVIERVMPHPSNPEWVLAVGKTASYVSYDHGKQWHPIVIGDSWATSGDWLQWNQKERLLALSHNSIHWSTDGGRSWKEKWLGYNLWELGTTVDGQSWIFQGVKDGEDRFMLLKFEYDDPILEPAKSAPAKRVPPAASEILVGERKISAVIGADPRGGSWAATASGVYHRAKDGAAWERMSTGMAEPPIRSVRQLGSGSPTVLAIDAAGRLWHSADFGIKWVQRLDGGVEQATFSGDSTILTASRQLKIVRHTATQTTDLSPTTEQLPDLLFDSNEQWRVLRRSDEMGEDWSKQRLAEMLDERLAEIHACDLSVTDDGKVWLVISDSCPSEYGREPLFPVSHHFRRDVLLVRSPDGVWNRQPISALDEAQPTANKAGGCELSAYQGHIRLQEREIDTFFSYMDRPQLAGWLGGRRYFVFGQQGLQISTASVTCEPGYPATLWTWNYLGWDSQIRYPSFRWPLFMENAGSTKILLPSERGFWSAQVPHAAPWSWRRLVHWGVHHHVVWFGWLAFAFWVMKRRRHLKVPARLPNAAATVRSDPES